MEYDINEYYEANFPGQVEVLGCDQWNGSWSQLTTYASQSFALYTLLQQCGDLALQSSYGISYDNYLVVDQNGVIRYISPYQLPKGERYIRDDIRAAIDGLVVTSVGDEVPRGDAHSPAPPRALSVTPSVVRNGALFAVTGADGGRTLRIVDTRGREVRRLALSGNRARWDARDAAGRDVPAGVYVAIAPDGATTRRFVVAR